MYDLTDPDFLKKIRSDRPDRLLVIHVKEIIYPNQATEITQALDNIGLPADIIQLTASHKTNYNTLGLEWCSHSGWIYENTYSSRYIQDHIVDHHHNTYYGQTNIDAPEKLLVFVGKVRWPHRTMFWDSFVHSGRYQMCNYSYYDMLPHSVVKHQQSETIESMSHRLLTNPDTWPALTRVAEHDIDLTTQVPEYAPDINNLFHCGYPTNPDAYHFSSGSFVCETSPDSDSLTSLVPFCTEKTYRTIQNNHPFLVFGSSGQHQHLKNLGYETFESEFGVTSDPGDIMATLDHAELSTYISEAHDYFTQNVTKNFDIIREKTLHNRYQWLTNLESDRQLLKPYDRHDLTAWQSGDTIINLYDHMCEHHNVYLNQYQPNK